LKLKSTHWLSPSLVHFLLIFISIIQDFQNCWIRNKINIKSNQPCDV
jgi:hypothetical protein